MFLFRDMIFSAQVRKLARQYVQDKATSDAASKAATQKTVAQLA